MLQLLSLFFLKGTSLSVKGSGSSVIEGRASYASGIKDSPKYTSKDYASAALSHGYDHKSELSIPEKMAEYATLERRQFAERQGAYLGRDLPVDAIGRYADSSGYAHKVYFSFNPLFFSIMNTC